MFVENHNLSFNDNKHERKGVISGIRHLTYRVDLIAHKGNRKWDSK